MDQVFSAIVSTAQQMEVEQRMTKKSNQRKLAEERQQARSKKKRSFAGRNCSSNGNTTTVASTTTYQAEPHQMQVDEGHSNHDAGAMELVEEDEQVLQEVQGNSASLPAVAVSSIRC